MFSPTAVSGFVPFLEVGLRQLELDLLITRFGGVEEKLLRDLGANCRVLLVSELHEPKS